MNAFCEMILIALSWIFGIGAVVGIVMFVVLALHLAALDRKENQS